MGVARILTRGVHTCACSGGMKSENHGTSKILVIFVRFENCYIVILKTCVARISTTDGNPISVDNEVNKGGPGGFAPQKIFWKFASLSRIFVLFSGL